MKILNFGSLNLDFVYHVPHIAAPGETLAADKLEIFPGGKGLNQSVALARAGIPVYHAGMLGEDGGPLYEVCRESGVDTRYLRTGKTRTGNAVIQVSGKGENSIVLFGGANREISRDFIRETLSHFLAGDCLLLQNEINLVDELIDLAHAKGMTVALNPSPYNETLERCDFTKVNLFLLNEVECRQMTGEDDPAKGLAALCARYPEAEVVLTLGGDGVRYRRGDWELSCPACPVDVVDTTGAGDTFTGYFLASRWSGQPVQSALELAAAAAALAVSRQGAAGSIPTREEAVAARNRWFPEYR